MENKEELDWRKSAKADELREYIDKVFKPKKPTIGGLDREIIIDFIAKERALADKQGYMRGVEDALRVLPIKLEHEKHADDKTWCSYCGHNSCLAQAHDAISKLKGV